MNIRTKLTTTFFVIVTVVLTAICIAVYFLSASYRETDFYRRLRNRAINTAKILVEVKEVNADLLRRIERNNPASLPNQYIVIFDNQYQLLYASDDISPIPVDEELLASVRRAGEMQYTHAAFEVLGFVLKDDAGQHMIVAAATDVYGLDALRNLRNVLLATFGFSLVVVSIAGWFFSGKMLRPISRIVEEVSNITAVNLNRRLNEGNERDELSMLAKTFNRMLERLQDAFASQKTFIANASHEIKTPITVMAGEIEVTLLLARDKEYYTRVLGSVLAGLKGLNQLSTQLLLLAQTSADQPEKSFTAIRIDDALWEIKEELTKAYPSYQVSIVFDLSVKHESLVVEGDEQLVKVAILNLMDNGCKYADDGHVTISLDTATAGAITLRFANTGQGIPPEHMQRIFDPFFRNGGRPPSRGFGIGLSLVRQIVKLHGGTVSVESSPRQTVFAITFPLRGGAVATPA